MKLPKLHLIRKSQQTVIIVRSSVKSVAHQKKKKALMAINVHFHGIKICHLKSRHGVQRNFSRSSILVCRSTSESFDIVFS